jgi:lysophospholipase L1-like esterase
MDLGDGFSYVNSGIADSRLQQWIDTYLEQAITSFEDQNVDVVSIMFGANEARDLNSSGDYKAKMTTITTRLKEAGFKKIILNEPLYTFYLAENQRVLLNEYATILDELADGETILRGDEQGFEIFEDHQDWLGDGLHPNATGYAQLGKLRSTTIKSVLEYQINPNTDFLDGNTHTL